MDLAHTLRHSTGCAKALPVCTHHISAGCNTLSYHQKRQSQPHVRLSVFTEPCTVWVRYAALDSSINLLYLQGAAMPALTLQQLGQQCTPGACGTLAPRTRGQTPRLCCHDAQQCGVLRHDMCKTAVHMCSPSPCPYNPGLVGFSACMEIDA